MALARLLQDVLDGAHVARVVEVRGVQVEPQQCPDSAAPARISAGEVARLKASLVPRHSAGACAVCVPRSVSSVAHQSKRVLRWWRSAGVYA